MTFYYVQLRLYKHFQTSDGSSPKSPGLSRWTPEQIEHAEKLRIEREREIANSKEKASQFGTGGSMKQMNPAAAKNPFCAACGEQIGGQAVEMSGSSFHAKCFKCTSCSLALIGAARCLNVDGKPVIHSFSFFFSLFSFALSLSLCFRFCLVFVFLFSFLVFCLFFVIHTSIVIYVQEKRSLQRTNQDNPT